MNMNEIFGITLWLAYSALLCFLLFAFLMLCGLIVDKISNWREKHNKHDKHDKLRR
jgi:hypothetical protein